MRHRHSPRDLAHRATHRVPGVPPHAERPPGHQGQDRQAHGRPHTPAHHRSRHRHHQGFNHSPARPPRVLTAWQSWIAHAFGQELR
ncbi:hypothetical protein AB0K60_37570 [Thermopolyspora sp. NPDC052614]|uniref:hypothetical protein n=1 Tax=Thermopolyspora sp. NPDC052614 TaxID=3155682 RepID=UPI0034498034